MHELDTPLLLELTEAKKAVLENTITKDGYRDYKNEFFDIKSENDRVGQFISEVKKKYQEKYKEDNTLFVEFVDGFITLMKEYPALIRLLLYKIYSSKAKFDCDVAEDVLKELAKFLPSDNSECCINKQGSNKYEICTTQNEVQRKYRGDTMNSFWSLFKSFLQNCLREELSLKLYRGQFCVPNAEYLFKEKAKSSNFKTWTYYFVMKFQNIKDPTKLKNLKQFNKFAEVNHTLGNFFLVPYVGGLGSNNFNTKRSLFLNDNFDLTLKDIENIFNNQLHSGVITSDMMYWIKSYNSFDDFIAKNKLNCYLRNSYVEHISSHDKSDIDEKDILNFFEENKVIQYTHTSINSTCPCFSITYVPKTLDDINSYLTYIIQKITDRNEELESALKEIENNN